MDGRWEEIVAILLGLGRVATFARERNHISPKWFPPLISDHRGGGDEAEGGQRIERSDNLTHWGKIFGEGKISLEKCPSFSETKTCRCQRLQ